MRLGIIGAAGFVGQRIAQIATADKAVTKLVLSDIAPFEAPPGAEVILGSFTDPAQMAEMAKTDAVILLASILGGAAEQNYDLSRQINVDAVLTLFEQLRDANPGLRVVFASSIAVLGDMPDPVTDRTEPAPSMTYGAQKLMMEVALSNFTRKGWLDGISLRLSGVMARDGADAALKTAFMSRLFWCVARGEDITLPVSPDARTWLTSVDTAALNFLHAASHPDLGNRRALTLPALCTTFHDLVAALHRAFPDSPSKITYAPDPDIMTLFGSFPRLQTPAADQLGFACDADADALVMRAMGERATR